MKNRILTFGMLVSLAPVCLASPASAQTPEATDPPQEKPDETPQQKAHRERMEELQRKEELAKQKEETRNAEAAAAASALGPLGTYEGAKGDVGTSDAEHGKMETTLLSSAAVREAAVELANRLCIVAKGFQPAKDRDALACTPTAIPIRSEALTLPSATSRPRRDAGSTELCDTLAIEPVTATATGLRPIVIVPDSETGFVDLAEAFEVRSLGIGRELCAAIAFGDQTTARTPRPMVGGEIGGGSLAAAGAIVNAAANLLRSDYTIFGFDITADQDLLVRELARALMASGARNPVYAPSLFPVSTVTAGNPVLRRLELLDAIRAIAVAKIAEHQAQSAAFERALANAGDRTAEYQAAKADHDAAIERLRGAVKAYDDAVNELTSPQGTQPPAMAAIIRQANTATLLRAGALLVVTDVTYMGGTAYTQKNFFTFLGGMPYHASGGASVGYSVHDGNTGQLWDASSVLLASGFVRPTQLRRALGRN